MSDKVTVANHGSASIVKAARRVITTTTINNYHDVKPQPNTARPARPFIVFGMYEGWSYSPQCENPFQIENINVDKLTHVTYAYIQPNIDGSINYVDNDQNREGKRFGPFLRLKHQNPDIKMLLSLGGWMEDSTIFPNVIRNDDTLRVFVKNLRTLFEKFQFDGLNLAWLYPKSDEKVLFVKFFSELRKDVLFKDLILAMVISNDQSSGDTYDFKELNRHVDYYNIMSYAFSRHEPKTEFNAPIALIADLINYLEESGIEHKKIVLGLGFRGLKFNLKDAGQNGLNCDCLAVGEPLTAFQINKLMSSGIWETVPSENGISVYSYSSGIWISHENESSISAKTKYAFRCRYAGVMVDAINCEMASDTPLLNAIGTTLAEINK